MEKQNLLFDGKLQNTNFQPQIIDYGQEIEKPFEDEHVR